MRQPERPLYGHETVRVTPVTGGHMNYERLLIDTSDDGLLFAKLHSAEKFTDSVRERHSREYLHKEQAMMSHLRREGYADVPAHSRLADTHSLVMEGLSPEDDWQWRATQHTIDTYIDEVTAALTRLEQIQRPSDFFDSHAPTHRALIDEGWASLDSQRLGLLQQKLRSVAPRLQPRMLQTVEQLIDSLPTLCQRPLPATPPTRLCHHDMRQTNVAWHEQHGVRIVDWSWAGIGLEKADHTSLLVDLHKSGHDVSHHLSIHFNPDHAHLMLGFLLARAIAPSGGSGNEVRFHQTVSAVSTFDLLTIQETTR